MTVDAESELIPQGLDTIAGIRDEVEQAHGVRLPIVWFLRFQRGWDETLAPNVASDVPAAPHRVFDGFELAGRRLSDLVERGDEVGWHYHAYHYVHRRELDPAVRLAVLAADLRCCAGELRSRHGALKVSSFRFGWLFVPDPQLFATLAEIGIEVDASVDPARAGHPVADFPIQHPPAAAVTPTFLGSLLVYPRFQTLLIHDWTVLPHDLGWSRRDEPEAAAAVDKFRNGLSAIARDVRSGGEVTTYRDARARRLADG